MNDSTPRRPYPLFFRDEELALAIIVDEEKQKISWRNIGFLGVSGKSNRGGQSLAFLFWFLFYFCSLYVFLMYDGHTPTTPSPYSPDDTRKKKNNNYYYRYYRYCYYHHRYYYHPYYSYYYYYYYIWLLLLITIIIIRQVHAYTFTHTYTA